MKNKQINKQEIDQEPPPILSSWNRLYIIVLLSLAANIFLFSLFTKFFK